MEKEELEGIQQEEDFYGGLIRAIHELSREGYKLWPSEQMEKIRRLANQKVIQENQLPKK